VPVDTSPRYRLDKHYGASRWETVFGALFDDVLRRRGKQLTEDGTISPALTNQEAVALIAAFRALAVMTRDGFPLWAQYAGVAYDFGRGPLRFNTSLKQMGRMYPADIGVGLWSEGLHIFASLEKERPDVPSQFDVDADTFQSLAFVNDVKRDLQADADKITASKKIPFPACRDKKTGKLRFPRPPCDKDGKGPIEPVTGRRMPCDKRGDCDPVVVDDPITAVGKSLVPLVVGGVILWWLLAPNTRRRRR